MQKEKPCILNEYKVFLLGAADGSRTHLKLIKTVDITCIYMFCGIFFVINY